MANYDCCSRTNYFHVTDKDKYIDLFENHIAAESDIIDFSQLTEKDGATSWVYGFGCYGSIDGYVENKYDEDEDGDFDKMLEEIQKLLPDGECFVLVQSGHEKLRFVDGGAVYVTNEVIRYHGVMDWIRQQAKECGTDNWNPTY